MATPITSAHNAQLQSLDSVVMTGDETDVRCQISSVLNFSNTHIIVPPDFSRSWPLLLNQDVKAFEKTRFSQPNSFKPKTKSSILNNTLVLVCETILKLANSELNA